MTYHYSEKLDLNYLLVLKTQQAPEEIYIPITNQRFTFADFNNYQTAFQIKAIVLAVCDPGSTILYYKAISDFSN